MAKASPKLILDEPVSLPLDKLVIHTDNVRKIDPEDNIEELAADIARRGLIQSLSVRLLLDEDGKETGLYGVQAGGRRWRALQLLVKQKKLAKNAPIPCLIRVEGFVEADSLAENTARKSLHPIDEFRAFASLQAKGQGEDTIAAAFGVTHAIVKQRLRLAKASPDLLQAYQDNTLPLEQLMAFCLIEDHDRQNQVWALIQKSWDKSPRAIRRLLTEKTVAADDRRVLFVGADAYKAAGGLILRDLFDEDDGGWLQDVPLLERLAGEKIEAAAETLRAEGWKWIESAIDFPWNHKRDYLAVKPKQQALSEEEQAEYDALAEEHDLFECAEDELSEEDRKRFGEVLARIDELEAKPAIFEPKMIAKSGAFISLDDEGNLVIDRGYIHPDDIKKTRTAPVANGAEGSAEGSADFDPETGEVLGNEGDLSSSQPDAEEDAGPAIPERLKIELTAYRTLALRNAVANNFEMAFLAVLHSLTEKLFYTYDATSSLQIQANDTLTSPFPGLADFRAGKAVETRHESWTKAIPENASGLWDWLLSLDRNNRESLFAHCAGLTVNAVYQPHYRCDAKKRHADILAAALDLDMEASGWTTTTDNYLGRVTKAAILDAVREAKGEETADLLADLKKKEMAQEAERLIAGTGWLPDLLRTPEALDALPENAEAETALPAFLDEPELQAAE